LSDAETSEQGGCDGDWDRKRNIINLRGRYCPRASSRDVNSVMVSSSGTHLTGRDTVRIQERFYILWLPVVRVEMGIREVFFFTVSNPTDI
jgi:hypothetical protein